LLIHDTQFITFLIIYIMQPEVSIVIPCYNQAQYLAEALESVLAQTFNDWECIIVSDGSPDNVSEVARRFVNKDQRIQFYDTENGGPSAARNFGIGKASGKYILPLDGDDKISENYVEECFNVLNNNTRLKMAYGSGIKFGLINEKWKLKKYNWNELIFGKMMIHPCGMYRKSDWESIGGYDPNMIYHFEDWEFWINLLKVNQQCVMLEDITLFYRVKEVSRTKISNAVKEDKMRQYIYYKHTDIYDKYFPDPIQMYNEYELFKKFHNYVQERPLRFLLSRIRKNIKQ
jgi:glycosyltransferase involved in cell wall biosynthesis